MKDFLITASFLILAAVLIVTYINGGPTTITTETNRVGNLQIQQLQNVEK